MPHYLVERSFAERLELTKDAVHELMEVNADEGVEWVFSFLSADKKKAYCLYEAADPDSIYAAARRNNVPVDAIIEVTEVAPAAFV